VLIPLDRNVQGLGGVRSFFAVFNIPYIAGTNPLLQSLGTAQMSHCIGRYITEHISIKFGIHGSTRKVDGQIGPI
jgi:hypothetical protein